MSRTRVREAMPEAARDDPEVRHARLWARVIENSTLPKRDFGDRAMRLLPLRLRTLMVGIAFLALILTVTIHAILLQKAAVREEQLRAEAAFQMAEAALERAMASGEERRQAPPAEPEP